MSALYNIQGLPPEGYRIPDTDCFIQPTSRLKVGQTLRFVSLLGPHNYKYVSPETARDIGRFEKQHISTAKRVGIVFLAILLLPLTLLGLAIGSALLHKSPHHQALVAIAKYDKNDARKKEIETQFEDLVNALIKELHPRVSNYKTLGAAQIESLRKEVQTKIDTLRATIEEALTAFYSNASEIDKALFPALNTLFPQQFPIPERGSPKEDAQMETNRLLAFSRNRWINYYLPFAAGQDVDFPQQTAEKHAAADALANEEAAAAWDAYRAAMASAERAGVAVGAPAPAAPIAAADAAVVGAPAAEAPVALFGDDDNW